MDKLCITFQVQQSSVLSSETHTQPHTNYLVVRHIDAYTILDTMQKISFHKACENRVYECIKLSAALHLYVICFSSFLFHIYNLIFLD